VGAEISPIKGIAMKRWLGLLAPITLPAILPLSALAQFDRTHTAWTALLKKYVVVIADRLDAQFEEQARRFLADRSRNHLPGLRLGLAGCNADKLIDWAR
jgi:hypothetical protein